MCMSMSMTKAEYYCEGLNSYLKGSNTKQIHTLTHIENVENKQNANHSFIQIA